MQRKLDALRRLLEVIDALRGPEGCPWDRAQTLDDMKRYLLEETCEAVDAIEAASGRPTRDVSEELGDVLMNVVLASRIAEDARGFDVADVADGIAEKLVRRHPHVFGDRPVAGVEEVLTNWNAIKEQEKLEVDGPPVDRASRLDGIPRSLPALERAWALGRAAAKSGFDWPEPAGAFDKVVEETQEVRALLQEEACASDDLRDRLESELGDLLFATANLCRKLDISPEKALRRTLRKFCERFQAIEARFPDLRGVSLEEMETVWQEAKRRGRSGPNPAPGEIP